MNIITRKPLETQPRKPAYLQFDNLMDRREIYFMLERLPPWKRLQWLRWCTRQIHMPEAPNARPIVAARSTGIAMEVYHDCWHLAAAYSLDLDLAFAKLTQMVRRYTS
jgi:hypothetical protein